MSWEYLGQKYLKIYKTPKANKVSLLYSHITNKNICSIRIPPQQIEESQMISFFSKNTKSMETGGKAAPLVLVKDCFWATPIPKSRDGHYLI